MYASKSKIFKTEKNQSKMNTIPVVLDHDQSKTTKPTIAIKASKTIKAVKTIKTDNTTKAYNYMRQQSCRFF